MGIMNTEPRLELKIGSTVVAVDGSCGHLQQCFLHPQKRRVVALVVQRDLPFVRPVIVPLAQVTDANDCEIRLAISCSKVAALPEYVPRRYATMAVESHSYGMGRVLAAVQSSVNGQPTQVLLPPNPHTPPQQSNQPPAPMYVLVRAGQRVFCGNRHAGRVTLLLLDSEGRLQHIVVRRRGILGREVIVPIDWVQQIDRHGVHLSVEESMLAASPGYRSDREIAAEVDQALWNDEVVHAIDYHAIDVIVRDSVVILTGYVTMPESKVRAEQIARAVRGVNNVENHLIVDGEVVHAVAQALAYDSRTQGHPIHVHVERGIVYLGGQVHSAAIRAAAEMCAAGVPNVRGVVNQLHTPGMRADAEEQHVVQPRIGQEVHATDWPLGHVEQVIINPHNRRVTAFVAHGWMPDRDADAHKHLADLLKHERHIVIPITAVQDVTEGGVLLDISSGTAVHLNDFDPAAFARPDAEWQPPYPYHHDEVILDQPAHQLATL